MSCTPPVRTVTAGIRVPAFSKGGGSGTGPSGESEVFVLTSAALMQIAPLLSKVRATLRIENSTENFEAKVVYQLTNDGENWDSPVDITTGAETGGYVSGDGYDTSNWLAIANTKRGIRFGVRCAQKTGTAIEMGRISVVLDLELVS